MTPQATRRLLTLSLVCYVALTAWTLVDLWRLLVTR